MFKFDKNEIFVYQLHAMCLNLDKNHLKTNSPYLPFLSRIKYFSTHVDIYTEIREKNM